MIITIFIGGLSGGGAERVCCNIAGFLADRGHNVKMLSMVDDEATYGLNPKVNRIDLIKSNERRNFLHDAILRYKRLYQYVKQADDDAFIVMLPITILMLFSLKGITRAKFITSERNMPTLYPKWQQCAMKLIASKVDGWIFQTQDQKEWYGDSVDIVKSIIIPNAIDEHFLNQPYSGARTKKIVSVGRLMPQKNHALLINAFAKISNHFPDYTLHIYGEGPLKEELEKKAISLSINNKIFFEGYVKDVAPLIKDASLFVLSSDFEGMPNALMEAMALGLPCVSTDCNGGGARFLISNDQNGILVPQKDTDALANAMIEILSDGDKALNMGIEANKICAKLHPTTIYSMWENFIDEIINS